MVIEIQMYGVHDMEYKNKEYNLCVDSVINHVFALLPLYEDNGMTDELRYKINFASTQIHTLFNICKNKSVHATAYYLDLISHLEMLKIAENHSDMRKSVLKICALLSELKVGEDNA